MPGEKVDRLDSLTDGSVREVMDDAFLTTEEPPTDKRPEAAILTPLESRQTALSHVDGELIRVFPSSVQLHGFDPETTYIVKITVKNTDDRSRRVHILPPKKTSPFVVSYIPQGSLAPGLEVVATLEFHGEAGQHYDDKLVICSDRDRIEIPLQAHSPAPKLKMDRHVNIGPVAKEAIAFSKLAIKNEGELPGKFSITYDDGIPIKVTPQVGIVNQHEELQVHVEFLGAVDPEAEPGPFRALAKIAIDGEVAPRMVEFSATIMEQRVDCVTVDETSLIDLVQFPTVFFGQQTQFEARFQNVGPELVSYHVHIRKQSSGDESESDSEDLFLEADSFMPEDEIKRKMLSENCFDQPMHMTPNEGQILPGTSQKVVFRFSPQLSPSTLKGFKHLNKNDDGEAFSMTAVFSGTTPSGLSQNFTIPLMGRALRPLVELSQQIFNFGECAVNGHVEIMFQMRNSGELPIEYTFTQTASFKSHPSKGKLPPKVAHDIVLSFTPKQLGSHHHVLKVSLMKGVISLPIKVRGAATAPILPKKLKGGTMALPVDFAPSFNFVDPRRIPGNEFVYDRNAGKDDSEAGGGGEEGEGEGEGDEGGEDNDALRRIMPSETIEEHATKERRHPKFTYKKLDELSDSLDVGALQYQMTKDERKKIQDHRDQWKSYLSVEHRKREMKKKGKTEYVDPENDFDTPHGGLREPQVALPRQTVDKEFLEHIHESTEKKRSTVSQQKPRVPYDENRLFRHKFKPVPTTAVETRDCNRRLNPEELAMVLAQPRRMSFGRVTVFSKNTKPFVVTNGLRQFIIVTLNTDSPELALTAPLSQTIPPGTTAGFDITFFTKTPVKNFSKSLTFTVNGVHQYKFLVTGEAVPAQLKLDRQKILFRFADDSLDSSVTEKLVLSNPGNHPAKFKWETPENTLFACHPNRGIVDPGRDMVCEIVFLPSSPVNREETLVLCVEDGADVPLTCLGQVKEAKCALNVKSIDFGIVAVGSSKTRSVVLRNVGGCDAVFSLPAADTDFLKVSPQKALIPVGGSQELSVTLDVGRAMVYESQVNVAIRCGKPLKFNVRGEGSVPEITIQQDEFDFGAVFVGTKATKAITLVNTSAFPAHLILDMRSYATDFSVVPPSDKEGISEDDETQFERVNEPPSAGVGAQPSQMSGAVGAGGAAAKSEASLQTAASALEPTAEYYKICVTAGRELTFQLTFQPKTTEEHVFELPLKFINSPTPRSMRRPVLAVGLPARVLMSKSHISFGQKVLLRDRAKQFPYSSDFTLSNESEIDVVWEYAVDAVLRPDSVLAEVFSVEPSRGKLAPGKAIVVRVTFNPRDPAPYTADVPLILEGDYEHPYTVLEIEGTGVYPSLQFDRREILLPVVPLGFKSVATFHLLNEGYENLEVKYKLPADITRVPLSLHFPDGQVIGVAKQRLPVEVSFVARKPLSFTAKIDFLDADGNRFSITVTGTSDNSILTLYPFLETHSQRYGFLANEAGPVMLVPVKHQPRIASPDSQHISQSRVIENIVRWLNAVLLKSTITAFPGDFVTSKGKALIDLVEFLSGKKVPNKLTKLSTNPKEYVRQLVSQYEGILTFLKSHGGLLNSVKPEFLLSKEDFIRFAAVREQKQQASLASLSVSDTASSSVFNELAAAEKFSAQHDQMALPAWLATMYQVIKVFILNRVTPAQVRTLPGMEMERGPDPTLSNSNVYSVAESILLKWLTVHYNRAQTDPVNCMRVTNFDDDLRDSRVLMTVIHSHAPVKEELRRLHQTCVDETQLEENALKVRRAIEALGLEYNVDPADISRCVNRDLLLLCLFLYQSLPQFLPKATIAFEAAVNESVLKTIELTNPSSRPIAYQVKLEGSAGFTIEHSQVRLDPKDTFQFPIKFCCQFSAPAASRVTFMSVRDKQLANAATLVFQLEAAVMGHKAVGTTTVDASLYDTKTVEVEVLNTFDVDFHPIVELVQYHPYHLDRKGNVLPKSKWPQDEDSLPLDHTVDAFFTKHERLRLRTGEKRTLTLTFSPFELGFHKAQIILMDKDVGEVMYEIQATVGLPVAQDTVRWQQEASGAILKELFIPHRNPMLDKARANRPREVRRKAVEAGRSDAPPPQIIYKVEYTSPHLVGPPEMIVTDQLSSTEKDEGGNKLQLRCNPQTGAGVYPGRMVLLSNYDVRVYDLEFTALTTGPRASLEFRGPARRSITQNIPIVNKTGKSWTLSATVQADNFHGPREIIVGPDSEGMYPLTFDPTWVCEVKGELVLLNKNTNEKYLYELHGVGEEPLALDHFSLKCEARQQITQVFKVINITQDDVHYMVESDLVGVAGEGSVKCPRAGSVDYQLRVRPSCSGTYTGSLTFIAPNNRYFWYTLELEVSPPPPEKTLKLDSAIRRAVAVDISVANPLEQEVTFDVYVEGHGLMGDSSLTLGRLERTKYELVYAPLLAGHHEGSLSFVSEEVGEFWYRLDMDAKQSDPIQIESMQCALGTMQTRQVVIENPVTRELVLEPEVSNPDAFTVKPSPLIIKPLGIASMVVEYTPTCLSREESTVIRLRHPSVGEWTYHASGTGLVPGDMENVQVTVAVGSTTSAMIVFENTLPRSLTVDIALSCPDDVFKLLMKRQSGIVVPARQELQIPVLFAPNRMENINASVVVSSTLDGTPLQWNYPVLGIAEAQTTGKAFKLKCQARTRLQKELVLPLMGVGEVIPDDDHFTAVLRFPGELEHTLRRATLLEPAENFRGRGTLTYKMFFEPLRPLNTQAGLVVTRASGGQWRFDVQLEATDPEIDDVIYLESGIDRTAEVSFRLTNQFRVAEEFEAFFAPSSAPEFRVSPPRGVLQPYGSAGTTFVVSYSPVEYRSSVTLGTLIILTKEMQWTYEVRGSHPRYQKPNVISRLDTQLAPEVSKKLRQTKDKPNYILHNINVLQKGKGSSSPPKLSPHKEIS
eukprot:Rmarinus@m.1878